MNSRQGFAVIAAMASVSVATAGPAFADDPMNGQYAYTSDTGEHSSATITSTCQDEGCVAHVVGVKGNVQGDATFTGGRWNLSVTNPQGDICDNKAFPADQVYSWDPVTLTGTLTSQYGPSCDGIPGIATTGFKLTKIG